MKPSSSFGLLEPSSRPLGLSLSSQTEAAVANELQKLAANPEVGEPLTSFGWELYFYSNDDTDVARGVQVDIACPDYRRLTTEGNEQLIEIAPDKDSDDPLAVYLALVTEVAQAIARHQTLLTDMVAFRLLHDDDGITTEGIHDLVSLSQTLTPEQEGHLWVV